MPDNKHQQQQQGSTTTKTKNHLQKAKTISNDQQRQKTNAKKATSKNNIQQRTTANYNNQQKPTKTTAADIQEVAAAGYTTPLRLSGPVVAWVTASFGATRPRSPRAMGFAICSGRAACGSLCRPKATQPKDCFTYGEEAALIHS